MVSQPSSSVRSRDPLDAAACNVYPDLRSPIVIVSSRPPNTGFSKVDDDGRPVPFPQNDIPGVIVQQAVLRLDGTEPCHHVARYLLGFLFRRAYTLFWLHHTNAGDILESESLQDVRDGMKGSRLRGNAKMNGAKRTDDIPVMQKSIHVVGPHLPKPSRDLPHPIPPKLHVKSVIKIIDVLEPVGIALFWMLDTGAS